MLDTSELPTSGRPSHELSQWDDVRRTMFDAPEPPPTSERRGHFPTHDAAEVAPAEGRAFAGLNFECHVWAAVGAAKWRCDTWAVLGGC